MTKIEMFRKKKEKIRTTIEFYTDSYKILQSFKAKNKITASNSVIMNDLIFLFLDMPDTVKETLTEQCLIQVKQKKDLYHLLTDAAEIKNLDEEIKKYERIISFLTQKK